jgi:hypothetical protein
MAEHDYVIANQNGANTRSDLNNALAAIVSNNSKATAPTTTYAFMWWADTANDILKQRNAADSAWINILTLSTGAPLATIANFTSTGIDDNATSTAITIDASEYVGIGTTTPSRLLHLDSVGVTNTPFRIDASARSQSYVSFVDQDTTAELYVRCGSVGDNFVIDAGNSERLRITSDGRGLSQFTAKAWINWNGIGTLVVNDSHNISSISDGGVGIYTINIDNNLSNSVYAVSVGAGQLSTEGSNRTMSVVSNTKSAGAFTVFCSAVNGSNYDNNGNMAIVFGD